MMKTLGTLLKDRNGVSFFEFCIAAAAIAAIVAGTGALPALEDNLNSIVAAVSFNQ